MLRTSIILSLFSLVIACKPAVSTTESEATVTTQSFGAGITNPDAATQVNDVLTQLNTQDTVKNIVLKGKVTGVCQTKGCWMSITDGSNPSEEELFVQFHDYGFFMPKDCAGKEVMIEGFAYKTLTSVEELKHYAEDEGKTPEEIAAITEPVTEKKFMATGAILL